jgi:molecular chaperone GrpE
VSPGASPQAGPGASPGAGPAASAGADRAADRAADREVEQPEGPVIRDRRRIDPLTGAVREPQPAAAPGPAPGAATGAPTGTPTGAAVDGSGPLGPAADARVAELEAAVAERTADLQRLQAEYLNYKRRVERDRGVVREVAVAGVVTALLPVLDDIGRAREHGELDGGFKAVAESVERTLGGLGLEAFGSVGDRFDPRVHEALTAGYSDDVDGPTCQAVLQSGYRIGERILRPARVAVVEPTAWLEPTDDVAGGTGAAAEPATAAPAPAGGDDS